MDWSTIATIGSVVSIPASIGVYVAWALTFGPAFTSKKMIVPTLMLLCFLTILHLRRLESLKPFTVRHLLPKRGPNYDSNLIQATFCPLRWRSPIFGDGMPSTMQRLG
jgi:hypothetical protein